MEGHRLILAVLVMATVTYIPRALPLTFFRRKIRSPWLHSFLYYVPYAVLGAMIFPNILYSTGNMKTAIVGLLVAMILALKDKSLLVVAIGGVMAVYITINLSILLK